MFLDRGRGCLHKGLEGSYVTRCGFQTTEMWISVLVRICQSDFFLCGFSLFIVWI